jgi:hypothetical protein
MNKEQLNSIKTECLYARKSAEHIMNGGDNYDGADGAREVLRLCELIKELIDIIETEQK